MSTPKRILVIANETCAGSAIGDEVRYRAGGDGASVLVIAPALAKSRVGHFLSSSMTEAREEAEMRLAASVEALRAAGLDATGELGDSDPLQALDDAFRVFQPDEIVISTHPPARSHWLEKKIVSRARERYPVPVTHVVVDLVHEAALTHADPRPGPPRVRPTITLYRASPYDEALTAQTAGFVAEPGTAGIDFTNAIPALDGDDSHTVFAVEIPEELVAPYDQGEADGVRRFTLPGELVNRHNPRVLATDWAE
jgi:hypothetical protein